MGKGEFDDACTKRVLGMLVKSVSRHVEDTGSRCMARQVPRNVPYKLSERNPDCAPAGVATLHFCHGNAIWSNWFLEIATLDILQTGVITPDCSNISGVRRICLSLRHIQPNA